MTPIQAHAFDRACLLNEQAGRAILHGHRFEAALLLAHAAEVPGLSEAGQVALLMRAAELLVDLHGDLTQTRH